MNTLYWITRLDAINGVLVFLLIVMILVSIVLFLMVSFPPEDMSVNGLKKYLVLCSISSIILLLSYVFTPTTKDAYIIYGVGGTIDYLKNNKEAKQLPEKAVKALNLFLDKECKTDSIKQH